MCPNRLFSDETPQMHAAGAVLRYPWDLTLLIVIVGCQDHSAYAECEEENTDKTDSAQASTRRTPCAGSRSARGLARWCFSVLRRQRLNACDWNRCNPQTHPEPLWHDCPPLLDV